MSTVEINICCTGRRGSDHTPRDLGTIIDERTGERLSIADAEEGLTALNELVAQLTPGQESTEEEIKQAAWRLIIMRTRLGVKGDRWFISAAGKRLQVPQQSLEVLTTNDGDRVFVFTCPTCRRPRNRRSVPEDRLTRLVDHLKSIGTTRFDIGKSSLGSAPLT